MENRAAPIYGEGTARFGSGQSEYYKDGVQGVFGNVNQNLSKEEYDASMFRAGEFIKDKVGMVQNLNPNKGIVDQEAWNHHKQQQRDIARAQHMGVGDRLLNAASGVAKAFVQNVALDTIDWAGEALHRVTGGAVGGDFGSEQYKADLASSWTGFNQAAAQPGMEHAKKVADKIYEDIKDSNKNVQLGDVAELIKTGIMNPELLG
jgi:hypothetical protein